MQIRANIQNVGGLHNLASLLCTLEDWEKRYNQIVYDVRILAKLNRFSALIEDAAESDIQARFMGILEAISDRLGIDGDARSETRIIIGGIMANYQYYLRSKTDPHFMNISGRTLIVTEAKLSHIWLPRNVASRLKRHPSIISHVCFQLSYVFVYTKAMEAICWKS